MVLKDKILMEKRTDDNLFDIFLYKEGNFWRAYEWSAYLAHNFPSDLKESERLKVSKKVCKDLKDDYVQVGFPENSFKKFFNGASEESGLMDVGENYRVIHAKSFFEDKNFEEPEKIIEDWKVKFDLLDNFNNKGNNYKTIKTKSVSDNITIDLIIDEIIRFPIESKTLIENVVFLSGIKENIIKLNNLSS